MLKRNKSSIIYNGNRIPYSQISHDANTIAAYLQSHTTAKSVIGIALPRTPFIITAM